MSVAPARRRAAGTTAEVFDVAVVGGGPAGISTALWLRRLGHRVVVVERSGYDDVRIGEHLAPPALAALERLDARPLADPPRARPLPGTSSAWGDDALLFRSDIDSPWGPGRTISRPGFDAALAELAAGRGASVRRRCRVHDVHRDGDGWRLVLPDATIACAALVDATGRRGWLARRLGARLRPHDALVAVAGRCPPPGSVRTQESSVWVEALSDGWWYSALLPDGALMAVWLTDADALRGHDPGRAWLAALERTRHTRRRVLTHAPPPAVDVRSARSASLDRAAGPGWLAVGDAALCRDPLSSSGLALALAGGERAAQALDAHGRGHTSALPEHDAAIQRELARYLATRASVYELEARWPDAPFWARRQRSAPSIAPT